MANKFVVLHKKEYVIIVFGFIAISNIASSDNSKKKLYRKKAWNSLSEEEQSTVLGNWKEAIVSSGSYWLTNEKAIKVVFTTTEDQALGPIIVYIDPETKNILGQSLRM